MAAAGVKYLRKPDGTYMIGSDLDLTAANPQPQAAKEEPPAVVAPAPQVVAPAPVVRNGQR